MAKLQSFSDMTNFSSYIVFELIQIRDAQNKIPNTGIQIRDAQNKIPNTGIFNTFKRVILCKRYS